MKFIRWASLVFSLTLFNSQQVLAVWEFPNTLNVSSGYEGGTLAPANTGSTFFQNLLKKINFGGSETQTVQNNNTSNNPTYSENYNQTGSTQNSSSYSPSTINTTSYDAEYQKILKQNLGGLPKFDNPAGQNVNTQNDLSASSFGITNSNQQYLTNDEIAKKFENFILQVNKIRSGYSTNISSNTGNNASQNQGQNYNLTPQQQQQIMGNVNGNIIPTTGTMCDLAFSPQEKQQCAQQLKTSCQRSYLTGEGFFSDCSQLPANVYAGLQYGSQPNYTLDNFTNHDPYYQLALKTIGVSSDIVKSHFPQQFFNKEGGYIGPAWNITGKATHYACTKKNGQYTIDTNLITTYKHITAYGIKAMWSIAAGDDRNACNFNYCGVAVPQKFVISAYGSVAAGKNQLIQITNMNNLKCTVAPIQDFSATKNNFTHPGSNAVLDLSLCVMERLGGFGKIDVQYRPLKKGEVGCNMSVQATVK